MSDAHTEPMRLPRDSIESAAAPQIYFAIHRAPATRYDDTERRATISVHGALQWRAGGADPTTTISTYLLVDLGERDAREATHDHPSRATG